MQGADFLPLIVYFWIGGILSACNDAVPIPCFALMITRLSELRSAWYDRWLSPALKKEEPLARDGSFQN